MSVQRGESGGHWLPTPTQLPGPRRHSAIPGAWLTGQVLSLGNDLSDTVTGMTGRPHCWLHLQLATMTERNPGTGACFQATSHMPRAKLHRPSASAPGGRHQAVDWGWPGLGVTLPALCKSSLLSFQHRWQKSICLLTYWTKMETKFKISPTKAIRLQFGTGCLAPRMAPALCAHSMQCRLVTTTLGR